MHGDGAEPALGGGLDEDDLVDDAEVDTMIRQSIMAVVGEAPFAHAKADAWGANIVEGVVKRLASLAKPFKYVVTCNLSQKAGAGLHAAHCTRWDGRTDAKIVVDWENETTAALVTVYALAA